MKNLVIVLGLVVSTSAFAGNLSATCSKIPGKAGGDNVWDGVNKFSLTISGKDITLSGSGSDLSNTLKGTYSKIASSGDDQYSSSDVSSLYDQSEYGSVFVSPKLESGNKGEVSLSLYQEDDDAGGAWYDQHFNCEVKK